MSARRRRRLSPRAALAVLAAVLAPAASAQVAQRLDDLRLATAVRLALVDDVRTRALDVTVTARDGGVEVQGEVPGTSQRTVTEVARAVSGVRAVGGTGAAGTTSSGVVLGRPVSDAPASPTTIQPRPAAAASGPVYHTVERGDTLFGLARRYDTSVDAIQALNDRQSTGIRVGQRLRVR